MARFIEDRCIIGPHFTVSVADLFEAWTSWATDDGADALSKNGLSEKLDKRGFSAGKSGSRRVRKGGLGLLPEDDE